MGERPAGTVTFLFTDVEGSTQLLHELGDRYADVLGEHRRLLREAFAAHGGIEVDTQGDAFFVAFARASDGVAAAEEAQKKLSMGPIRVRMGLHTGEPLLTEEGYVGIDVHRAARIAASGHGGQVLLSEQTQKLLGEQVELRDLGLHRLKDLQAAEQIFQLGAVDFPPLKSLNQTNLPVQPTPFLGRQHELDEICRMLRREHVRLLTLTGPGGAGKTRLAVQVAAELVDEYPDGVWFVGLAALGDHELVLATIARTLGLREPAGATFEEAIGHHVRSRRLLLVLDNLEQLLPGAAPGLGRLLAGSPRLELLVASREPLGLAAEHEYSVGPLAMEEALALFAERAQATRSDFELLEEDRTAAEAICARLDRLPLAIELAATRIKVLPPQKLLERLDHRLPLLVGGAHDAPARQRTLRATIAWSYDLLSENERQLFARLAVFNGGCTLEAAEEVCEADLATLASLFDKSLLRRDDVGGEPRYFMLETIREYALERLDETAEADELRRSHAEHFLVVGEDAELQLKGPDQHRWLDRLEAEHDNLRGAIRWSLDREPELALRLASALWVFWYVHGHVGEGRGWLREALAVTELQATEARAKALDGAGYLAGEQGDEEARELLEASLLCAREAGSPASVAIAATHLSVNLSVEEPDRALALGEEAVSVAAESGDRYTLAVALNNLGEVARERGELERATALYEESYRLRRELGEPSRIALSLLNLGEMAFIAGDTVRARSLLSESLDVATAIGDKRHMCFALGDLGWVSLREGRAEESDRLFRESLLLSRELGHRRSSVATLKGLAAAAAAKGEAPRAARLAGAVDALEVLVGSLSTPIDAHGHEAHLDAARALCDDTIWEGASREGGAMSLDEAIEFALSPASG